MKPNQAPPGLMKNCNMSPQDRLEFEELKRTVKNLQRVEDVAFIENSKRRIARPVLGSSIQKNTTGDTSGVLRSVNEGGAATYNVAGAFTGTITIETADGNTYKLGYY